MTYASHIIRAAADDHAVRNEPDASQGLGVAADAAAQPSPSGTEPVPASGKAGIANAVWRKGDRFLVPGYFESAVAAVDFDDMQVMDECGGWHDMAEIERLS